MEPRQQGVPSGLHLAHRSGCVPVGLLDSGGQRLDAVSGRNGIRSRTDAQRDGIVRRCGPIARGSQQILPHSAFRMGARRRVRSGRELLVPLQEKQHIPCQGLDESGIMGRSGRHCADHLDRRRLGRSGCQSAAHETGCHGGSV